MNIGDRVQRVNAENCGVQIGDVGIIAGFTSDIRFAYVKWDKYPNESASACGAHDVYNLIPEQHGRPLPQSDCKPTNPKDRAATSRLDLSLFPQSAVIYGALAMTEGDCKYGGYNYRVSGVNMSVYVAALLRHIYKAYNGEWVDPVTKVPHFANAIACLAVLIDGYEQGNLKDDRPPVQDTAGLLKKSEEIVKHLQELYPHGPKRFTETKE